MIETTGNSARELLEKYILTPFKSEKNALGFITRVEGIDIRRTELRKAHEQAFGEAPNAFEEWCYGWLTLKGIEAKIIELKQKSEANKTAQ